MDPLPSSYEEQALGGPFILVSNFHQDLFVLFDRSKPPICPECVQTFQLSGASQEELTPYLRWTRPYELEEKKRRVKQLDAERKRAYRALKKSK